MPRPWLDAARTGALWCACVTLLSAATAWELERRSHPGAEEGQKSQAASQTKPGGQQGVGDARELGTAVKQPDGQQGGQEVTEGGKGVGEFPRLVGGWGAATLKFLHAHEGAFVALFTALLTLVTALLVKRTRQLWEATNGLLKFAGEQAADMKASLVIAKQGADAAVASHRPWVKIELEPATALERRDQWIGMGFNVRMTNIGTTPATGLQAWVKMSSSVGAVERARAEIPARRGETGRSLFPDEPSSQVIYCRVKSVEVEAPQEIGRILGFKGRRAMLSVVAALEYDFPGGTGRTTKAFHLYTDHEFGISGGVQIDDIPIDPSTIGVFEIEGLATAT